MTPLQRLVAARWQLFVMRDPKVQAVLAGRSSFTLDEIANALWPDVDLDTGCMLLAARVYPDVAELLAAGHTRFELNEALVLCLRPDMDDARLIALLRAAAEK